MVASSFNKIASIYKKQGKNYQSLEYFNKALTIASENKIEYEKAFALNYIGGIHFDDRNYEQANEYFWKAC